MILNVNVHVNVNDHVHIHAVGGGALDILVVAADAC